MNYKTKKFNINEVKEKYYKLRSIHKVGKLYGVSGGTISRYLKDNGIVIIGNTTKSLYNNDLFSENTQESHYWAGFIMADGNVSKNKKVLQLGLHKHDIDHLKKFITIINYTNKIYKYRDMRSIHAHSGKICHDLARYNIVPRKTKICYIPNDILNSDNINHFIRGYVDGDGSFFEHLPKGKSIGQLVLSIRGTEKLLHQISTVFKDACNISYKKVEKNSGWFVLRYEGNNLVPKIRDFLYNGSIESLRMDRKYNFSFKYKCQYYKRRAKEVVAISNTQIIEFESITEAIRSGYSGTGIYRSLNNSIKYKDLIWKYR